MPAAYKDHYQTLGVAPGATAEQIKKAWRKLVLDLHPDKTGNDPGLSVRFREIQQAYEVLSDPLQKIQFLQERWLRKAQGTTTAIDTADLATWIKACIALEKKVMAKDPDRVDQQTLHTEIKTLLGQDKIATLQSYAHPEAVLTGARLLLQAATILSYSFFTTLALPLAKVDANDLLWQKEIKTAIRKKWRERNWARYRIVVLVMLTILLCLLIAS